MDLDKEIQRIRKSSHPTFNSTEGVQDRAILRALTDAVLLVAQMLDDIRVTLEVDRIKQEERKT